MKRVSLPEINLVNFETFSIEGQNSNGTAAIPHSNCSGLLNEADKFRKLNIRDLVFKEVLNGSLSPRLPSYCFQEISGLGRAQDFVSTIQSDFESERNKI